jgi:hypothetical protein
MAFVMATLLLCVPSYGKDNAPAASIKVDMNFDHNFTSFTLEGAHLKVTCETCHAGAIFKGVPTTCFGCHNGGMAAGKPDSHPKSSDTCSDCHTNSKWSDIHVDHSKVSETCFSCHNGKTATGKNKLHIKSSRECATCHVVSTWSIHKFDHTMTSEPCERCHDNQQAVGKPFDHIRSNNDCGSCHKSVAWTIGVFDHTGIVDGCAKCHDDSSAPGKTFTHLPTSDQCQACHTTVAWVPTHFDHSEAKDVNNCADCHDGRRAIGRSAAHFKTNNDCGACHTTMTWHPARFDHDLALDVTTCFSCHNGQRPPADGKGVNHIASSNMCTDCHAATNFTSWTGASFNHVNVTGNCFACHNGTTATGKTQNHLTSTNVCESCHTPVAWKPGRFDHTQSTGLACQNCHDGTQQISTGPIVGKLQGPAGAHLPTSEACMSCHNTSSFIPSMAFDHGELSVGTCFTCHNGTTATSKGVLRTKNSATHIASGTDCETCHNTSNWKSAVFDHSGIGNARCDSCHNGTSASGLSGNHITFNGNTDCAACHVTTAWKAVNFDHGVVSTTCFSCHDGSTSISTGKLTSRDAKTHIPSGNDCESCHVTTTWKSAFNHANIGTATCVSCHNGTTATGKLSLSGKHLLTSDTCESCHTTVAWIPVQVFDHTQTSVTTCLTCHNGTDAKGKGMSHILSKDTCQNCHSTAAWAPLVPSPMDHAFVTGTCFSCHDGTHSTGLNAITGKPGTHLKTSNACANCHTTTAWTPAPFDHSQATGTCFSCHDGAHPPASTRSGGHVASSTDCAQCHTSTAWAPARFSHLDPTVAATACLTCHNGTVTNALSKADAPTPHIPSSDLCADCHTTTAFTPAHIDHGDPVVASRTCVSCHDVAGSNPVTRPPSHPPFNAGSQDCKDCHTTATWMTSGKPDHTNLVSGCFTCHNGTSATGKTPTHFTTSNTCESCHNTTAFKPAVFDHNEATNVGTCFACHDGSPAHAPALGKSSFPAHPASSNDCQSCHSGFVTWANATFKHDDPVVAATACFTCHDGNHAPAVGKLPTHLKSSTNCASCHTTIAWAPASFDHNEAQGTCFSCHDGAHPPAKSKANAPPPGHLPTSNVCEDCHTTAAWTPARFDHATVGGTACFTCHNGTRATGKGNKHFATTNTCEDCHTSAAWAPARFDHGSATAVNNCFACHDGTHPPADAKSVAHLKTSNDCMSCHTSFTSWTAAVNFSHDDSVVAAASCFSCHDGAPTHAPALGKSNTHLKTTNDCASCHVTTNWATVAFDHTQAQGTCFSCHDNAHPPALGKNNTHFNTSNACDSCHVTTKWTTVAFDHSQANGTCASCHDGAHPPAVGKGNGHFITSQPCETCHTTAAWSPVLPYTHQSPAYENHGSNTPTCLSCHKQNNEKIAFARPDLYPDCAACHVNKYKPDPHKKYTSPTTKLYTVDELRDCTGACHIYADQTLTTIKTRRTGPQHRATRSAWN